METIPPRQEGERAWYGAALQHSADWMENFTTTQIRELETAGKRLAAHKVPMEALKPSDFELPSLQEWKIRIRQILNEGRGFILMRGLPVERWPLLLTQYAYVGLGYQLGTLGSQNAAGDTLGHIRATGENARDPSVRRYKTTLEQPFHTDGGDVISLLCLQTARQGGRSRLCSSHTVYNEVLDRRPDLAPLLFKPFYFDRNDEQAPGEAPAAPLPLCHLKNGTLRTMYVGWYIRDAQRHPTTPRLTEQQLALMNLIEGLADDPNLHLEMEFKPGDIQLIKNCYTLHARTAYEDDPDPNRRRHLLRLWINMEPGDALLPDRPRVKGAQSDQHFL